MSTSAPLPENGQVAAGDFPWRVLGDVRGILPVCQRRIDPDVVAGFHGTVLADLLLILFPDKNAPRCAANFSFWLT